MTVLQDEAIIRLVLDGHIEAYASLVDRYKNLIFDLCYKYTYDYSDAQDLSQETFLKVYRKLDGFRFSSSFSTWLYRIGTNTCIDWTRKNKNKKDVTSMDDAEYMDLIPSQAPIPEEEVLDREKREFVRDVVESLPEKYRTVIILYNYKDLSCSEISDILGVPQKTVETRLYRAKKLLKEKLLKPLGGGEYLWNAVK